MAYRYKASFSFSGYKPYKYGLLRLWIFLGVALVAAVGEIYDLLFTSLIIWFFELLIIYLASDNKSFERFAPWMLGTTSLVLLIIYSLNFFAGNGIVEELNQFSQKHETSVFYLSMWYLVSVLIFKVTKHFYDKKEIGWANQ